MYRSSFRPIVTLSLVLGALLFVHAASFAAQGQFREVNWESLDLNSPQRSVLNNLNDQWRNTVSEIAPRIERNQNRLNQLMRSSESNEAEVLRLQQQIESDRARLKMEAMQIFLQKKRVLNSEQQQRLNQILGSH